MKRFEAAPMTVPGNRPVEAHIADAHSLLALLEQEREALQLMDHERLSLICREKAQVLTRLGGLLIAIRQPSTSSVSAEQRQQLQDVLLRCAQETRANDALLEARSARARRTLQALQGSPANYDGRGRGRYGLSGNLHGAA